MSQTTGGLGSIRCFHRGSRPQSLAGNQSPRGPRGRRDLLVVAGRWASSSLRRLCRQVLEAEADTCPSVQARVWCCPADRPASRPGCGAAPPIDQPPPEPLRPPRGAGEGLPGPEVGTGPGLAGRPGASRAREAADSPGPGLWTPSPADTTPSAGPPGPRVSREAGTPGAQWAVWFAPETVLRTRLSNPVTSQSWASLHLFRHPLGMCR